MFISIHAPSRERHGQRYHAFTKSFSISIHAPSRERQWTISKKGCAKLFQSTLPRGSDGLLSSSFLRAEDFNPRSLAGATYDKLYDAINHDISIHAPSRERLQVCSSQVRILHFNPRSLAGATYYSRVYAYANSYFNPRSLAGATHLFRPQLLKHVNFNPRSLAGATEFAFS